ncbi:MAG TPA: hypothetical protein VFP15_06015 [Gemmatimonadaceae bacterium]|nr:hypothetical protein [Gemmatimonadaceae bacterium]
MPRKVPFPLPPLPSGEFHPRRDLGHWHDLVQRDVGIIRWFIQDEMGLNFEESPLKQALDIYVQVDRNVVAPAFDDIPIERRQHGLHFSAQFERLAWAIWVLYGNDAVERMDGSFVRREIMSTDSKERGAEQVLPAGVGTMVFAARLVQAGGGRICLYGNQVEGHDIRWVTNDGDLVLVERKDRPYEPGLNDTPAKRCRWIIGKVNETKIPTEEPGAFRVLSVGFQSLVRNAETEEMDKRYERALREAFTDKPKSDLPHVVIIEHLGLEPRSGGEHSNFFSPQPLNLSRDEMDAKQERVLRLLVRAIGADPD